MNDTQPIEAEDLPGYDGPTLDAADRLNIWMDKSVPAADQDRLIAEHRDQVLTEAAELLKAEADSGVHIRYGSATDYADHYAAVLLAARTTQDRPCGCSARFTRHADGCPTLATEEG